MKQVKRGVKGVLVSSGLYALFLALATFLVMNGTVGEERLGTVCMIAAVVSSFLGTLLQRLIYKDASFLMSVLFGGGFYPVFVIAAILLGCALSLERVLLSMAAVAIAAVAANMLYAKSGLKRKKRGRGRSANR